MKVAAVVGLAVALAGVLGFVGGRSTRDDADVTEPGVIAEGELAAAPAGPLGVRAERVVLPSGFVSRHRHGGPTFNFVDAGTVVIESAGESMRHDAGGFFFEPAGRVHTITVLDDAQLRVVRLVPPGVEATTEVP